MTASPPEHRTRARARRALVASAVALALAAGVAAPSGASSPGARSSEARPGPVTAATLQARVQELDGSLAALDLELAATRGELDARRRDLLARVRDVEAAAGRRGRAAQDLRAYAVGAYVGGGDPASDLAEATLTAEGFSAELEVRRVLAAEGSSTLLAEGRAAAAEAEARHADLVATSMAAAAHQRDLDLLVARRADLVVEREAAARAAEEAARAEEEARRRAAELAAAEAEARAAGGFGPGPVASGAVPARTVPDEVVAAMGGEIPLTSLDAYWRAAAHVRATRPGCPVDWALVAAVGKVETSHGTYGGAWPAADGSVAPAIVGIPLDGTRGTARIVDTDGGWYDGDPVLDRAVGPMQFLPGTWRGFAVDANGDGIGDPHNVYDAAAGAAWYLCHNARGGTVAEAHGSAVHGYNRSWAYVAKVLGFAARYRALAGEDTPPADAAAEDPVA